MRKVLICVESLAYNRGGIASIGRLLSREFSKEGWVVTVLTHNVDGAFSYENVRIVVCPSKWEIFKEFRRTDYVVGVGDLLRFVWPLLILRRPSIIVKHGAANAKSTVHRFVERLLARRVAWGGVSQYVVSCDHIKSSVVVPNARDPDIFYDDGAEKRFDLLFVGGFTEEKGVMVLADSMLALKQKGVLINRLTMVGEGKDSARFAETIKDKLPEGCVCELLGNLDALHVADQMRRHKVVISPSMNIAWQEAFPLVPIEAQSCGCQVVVSDSGGLPESGGPCAQVFPCGDANALAACIENAITGRHKIDEAKVAQHLAKYTPQNMVGEYLALIRKKFGTP